MASRKLSAAKGKGGRRPKALPPKEPQTITLARAVDFTQRYRKASPASEHGGFFWAEGLKAVLEQPGCVGIRYYHGLDEKCDYQIVIVGVDAEGRDIVRVGKPRKAASSSRSARATGDAVILDNHWRCPPFCDPTSPLL